MLVAAPPAWVADNIAIIALAVLVAVTVLVLWAVHEIVARTILLALIAAVAVFAYANREPLRACASSCECQIAGQDISVPFCDPKEEDSARITPVPPRSGRARQTPRDG